MLAALSYDKKDIRVENIQIPSINEDEVLIKIEKAGICGADVRIYQNGLGDNKLNVLGHEFSGKIEKVGGNIKKFEKGMRVTANPNMGCGTCDFCISGNFHMCRDYYALGVQINGRSEEHTSELQSRFDLVCRLLLEKKKIRRCAVHVQAGT